MATPRLTQKDMTEAEQRDAEAKKARKLKKQQAYKPDTETTFSWSANTSTRGRR
ncbi:TPA: DUF3811 domain-containing protein [Enterobacter cloacae]|uniref:DUF3811 domain-containing protein n=1 Tax=Enterobacter cloacae TaxID=550 RepID=UPI000907DEFB|nr:DUF3811 domain-containing protein [Enterobacter cloacae]HEW9972454.1 DUF3811 domain-containing protein [Enterobacter cloacae]